MADHNHSIGHFNWEEWGIDPEALGLLDPSFNTAQLSQNQPLASVTHTNNNSVTPTATSHHSPTLPKQIQQALTTALSGGNYEALKQVQHLQQTHAAALPHTPLSVGPQPSTYLQTMNTTMSPSHSQLTTTHALATLPTDSPSHSHGGLALKSPAMSPTLLPEAALPNPSKARSRKKRPLSDRGIGSSSHPAEALYAISQKKTGTLGASARARGSRKVSGKVTTTPSLTTSNTQNTTGRPQLRRASGATIESSPMTFTPTSDVYQTSLMLHPSPFMFDPTTWSPWGPNDTRALSNLSLTSPGLLGSPSLDFSNHTSPVFHPTSHSHMDFRLGSPYLAVNPQMTISSSSAQELSLGAFASPGLSSTFHHLTFSQVPISEGTTETTTTSQSVAVSPSSCQDNVELAIDTLTPDTVNAVGPVATAPLTSESGGPVTTLPLAPATPASLMQLDVQPLMSIKNSQLNFQSALASVPGNNSKQQGFQSDLASPSTTLPILKASNQDLTQIPHEGMATTNGSKPVDNSATRILESIPIQLTSQIQCSTGKSKEPEKRKSTGKVPHLRPDCPMGTITGSSASSTRPPSTSMPPSFVSPTMGPSPRIASGPSTRLVSPALKPGASSSAKMPMTPKVPLIPSGELKPTSTLKVPISPLPRGSTSLSTLGLSPAEIAARLTERSNYQNLLTGDSQRLGLNYDHDLHSGLEQRRSNHKAAEQKRRDSLKRCFENLQVKVPNVDERMVSKVYLLNKASAYIVELEEQHRRDQEKIRMLQNQLDILDPVRGEAEPSSSSLGIGQEMPSSTLDISDGATKESDRSTTTSPAM
ncbi:hypothetical protein IWQ61_008648 [Dispira simplex]|nr:hypothetical protein IWQ61_008648 [Dispira simplex]